MRRIAWLGGSARLCLLPWVCGEARTCIGKMQNAAPSTGWPPPTAIFRHQAAVRQYLPEPLVWRYFLQLATAVAHMHAAGVVHRDLKPTNCMFRWGESGLEVLGVIARGWGQTARQGGKQVVAPPVSHPARLALLVVPAENPCLRHPCHSDTTHSQLKVLDLGLARRLVLDHTLSQVGGWVGGWEGGGCGWPGSVHAAIKLA